MLQSNHNHLAASIRIHRHYPLSCILQDFRTANQAHFVPSPTSFRNFDIQVLSHRKFHLRLHLLNDRRLFVSLRDLLSDHSLRRYDLHLDLLYCHRYYLHLHLLGTQMFSWLVKIGPSLLHALYNSGYVTQAH